MVFFLVSVHEYVNSKWLAFHFFRGARERPAAALQGKITPVSFHSCHATDNEHIETKNILVLAQKKLFSKMHNTFSCLPIYSIVLV